jgi:FKBP-type peptidyl-prolyl cis-trans isomerase SlyD
MKITPQCIVALTWTLKDTLGEILDQLDEPVEFLLGGDDLLTSIEENLQQHEAKDKLEMQLEPEQAFGDYDENKVFLEKRSLFSIDIEEGMIFDASALPPGSSADAATTSSYMITEIYPEHVVLDGNHPLAGIALRLSIQVESVREATLEEIGKGTLGTGFFKLAPPPNTNDTLH